MLRISSCPLPLLLLLAVPSLSSCGDSSEPSPVGDQSSQADQDSTDYADIQAHEIQDFELLESRYCVGQERAALFSDYNYQCEPVKGQGLCIAMPNPQSGNTYYCALCGLKGDEMVCYMINPE